LLNVVILSSTIWEVRKFIKDSGARKMDSKTFAAGGSKSSVILKITGIGRENAKRALESLSSPLPELVISTGFAGALRAGIKAGDLVLDIGRSDQEVSERFSMMSARNGIPIHKGTFWSGQYTMMTAEEKIRAGEKTGDIAAEMESQAVFEFCRERKIPFCSIRAVSDSADQDLPGIVNALGPDGEIGGRFLKVLLTHPSDWGKFLSMVLSSQKAEKSLSSILIKFVSGS
jgi:nucleoside phosphorylase